jgi:GntR family transcriptional regulator
MINYKSEIPLYVQVKDALFKRIQSGEWKGNENIPAEKTLEIEYGVSRPTITKAIKILINEGYLQRKRGVGTFVLPKRIIRDAQKLVSFTSEMKKRGFEVNTLVLESEIKEAGRVAEKLQLNKKDLVLKIVRIRTVEGEPISIQSSYVPFSYFPSNTTGESFNQLDSLYELLENEYNLNIVYAEDEIVAVPADHTQRQLLKLNRNCPLLSVRRTSYLDDASVIEYCEMFFPADKYAYHVKSKR